jgi:Protein tyrosine and serine/threonine kinase
MCVPTDLYILYAHFQVLETKTLQYQFTDFSFFNQGLRPTISKEINAKLAALIEKCWQQDPSLRPDFSQILEALHALTKEVLVLTSSA